MEAQIKKYSEKLKSESSTTMVNLKINRVDPIWKKRSAEAMDLIDRCLTLDPDNRITGA